MNKEKLTTKEWFWGILGIVFILLFVYFLIDNWIDYKDTGSRTFQPPDAYIEHPEFSIF